MFEFEPRKKRVSGKLKRVAVRAAALGLVLAGALTGISQADTPDLETQVRNADETHSRLWLDCHHGTNATRHLRRDRYYQRIITGLEEAHWPLSDQFRLHAKRVEVCVVPRVFRNRPDERARYPLSQVYMSGERPAALLHDPDGGMASSILYVERARYAAMSEKERTELVVRAILHRLMDPSVPQNIQNGELRFLVDMLAWWFHDASRLDERAPGSNDVERLVRTNHLRIEPLHELMPRRDALRIVTAIELGELDRLRRYRDEGYQINGNTGGRSPRTPLFEAAHHAAWSGGGGAYGIVLGWPGLDINAMDGFGHTVLYRWANGSPDGRRIREIRERFPDADPNLASPEFLDTPLKRAVFFQNTGAIRELLLFPAINVNAVDDAGQTPLHVAAVGGDAAVVEILLKAPGINPRALNHRGMTAWDELQRHIEWSSTPARRAVARLMERHGANVSSRDI